MLILKAQSSSGYTYNRATLEYKGRVYPCVEASVHAITHHTVEFCRKATSKIARQRRALRTPNFVKLTSRWLGDTGTIAVPSDKDGNFTLIGRQTWQTLVMSKLGGGCYRSVNGGTPSQMVPCIRTHLIVICKELRAQGLGRWAREARECNEQRAAVSMVTPVLTTSKTHKPWGSLAVRVIHASQADPLDALSRLAHGVLSRNVSWETWSTCAVTPRPRFEL